MIMLDPKSLLALTLLCLLSMNTAVGGICNGSWNQKIKPAEETVKNSKIHGHIYEIRNECIVDTDNLKPIILAE